MRILLIAPSFFGYRNYVRDELIRQGNKVECINDRPNEGTYFKSLAKISYQLVDNQINRYATQVRERIAQGSYDIVLYMGGMSFCFTRDQFEPIRKASKVKYVAYLWDAVKNCERFMQCSDLFDEIYSFEPLDCAQYGFKLRPLFYTAPYEKIPLLPPNGFKYDACFIGSVHQPSKFEEVSKICNDLESRGLKVFKYFYMPSRSAEIQRRAFYPIYRGQSFKHVPLSAEEVTSIYTDSKVIIDSPQAGQQGLTMRTIETVGARRKLITTNRDVQNYDFDHFGDIAIWEKSSLITNDFFESPYQTLPANIYNNYSLSTFVRALLGMGSEYNGYKAS